MYMYNLNFNLKIISKSVYNIYNYINLYVHMYKIDESSQWRNIERYIEVCGQVTLIAIEFSTHLLIIII